MNKFGLGQFPHFSRRHFVRGQFRVYSFHRFEGIKRILDDSMIRPSFSIIDAEIMPMKQFLFIFSLIFSICFSSYAQEASLTELAKAGLREDWTELVGVIAKFNEKTTPQEAKKPRKIIMKLRDRLDLFANVFSPQGTDTWKQTRESLDWAYEEIDLFKDLYDEQGLTDSQQPMYDAEEVQSLLKPILKWSNSFLANQEVQLSKLIQSMDGNKIYHRPKKQLSRFFWGAVDIEPKINEGGIANLRALSLELIKQAQQDYKKVDAIKNPASNEDQAIAFHDFRKRMRSISKLMAYYPALAESISNSDLKLVSKVQDEYGNLNDRIVLSLKLTQKGKDKKAEKLISEIEKQWKALKAQNVQDHVDEMLERLEKAF